MFYFIFILECWVNGALENLFAILVRSALRDLCNVDFCCGFYLTFCLSTKFVVYERQSQHCHLRVLDENRGIGDSEDQLGT